ncbi:uncharacterized [Tachysurus ichikawai]
MTTLSQSLSAVQEHAVRQRSTFTSLHNARPQFSQALFPGFISELLLQSVQGCACHLLTIEHLDTFTTAPHKQLLESKSEQGVFTIAARRRTTHQIELKKKVHDSRTAEDWQPRTDGQEEETWTGDWHREKSTDEALH